MYKARIVEEEWSFCIYKASNFHYPYWILQISPVELGPYFKWNK